jgi:hypothetical protein
MTEYYKTAMINLASLVYPDASSRAIPDFLYQTSDNYAGTHPDSSKKKIHFLADFITANTPPFNTILTDRWIYILPGLGPMKNTARDIIIIVASLVAIVINYLNISAGATGTGYYFSAFVILLFVFVIAVTLIRKYQEMG